MRLPRVLLKIGLGILIDLLWLRFLISCDSLTSRIIGRENVLFKAKYKECLYVVFISPRVIYKDEFLAGGVNVGIQWVYLFMTLRKWIKMKN